jgi:hypothetical protein
MADEQKIKRMEERIDNLERLLNSLLTQPNPASTQTTTESTPDATNIAQLTPPTTTTATNIAPKKEVLCLMTLPTEIRILIIEHLFRPLFRPKPSNKSHHGLILPRRLPISLFTGRTRFPAILHVNQTTRVESKQVYLKFARAKIAELEAESREAYKEWKVIDKTLSVAEWAAERSRLEVLAKMNVFKMNAFDKACRVLEGEILRR